MKKKAEKDLSEKDSVEAEFNVQAAISMLKHYITWATLKFFVHIAGVDI